MRKPDISPTPATENRTVPPTADELKRWAIIGLAGILGTAVVVKGAKMAWRNLVERKAWRDMTKPGSPQQVAERLHSAMNPSASFGWGTDEELIRETFVRHIPHRDFFQQVAAAYPRLPGNGGGILMEDLRSELADSEFAELQAIIDRLPRNAAEKAARGDGYWEQADIEAWARRIKAAADYKLSWIWPWGIDEEAVYAVFREVPTLRALDALNKHYRSTYGPSLVEELQEELDTEEQEKVLQIIKQKPQ